MKTFHFLRKVLFHRVMKFLLDLEQPGLKSLSSKLKFGLKFIFRSVFEIANRFLSLAADWYLMV